MGSDKELKDKRLASTMCCKCFKVGHVKADYPELQFDVQSNATGISDTQLSVSTAATARDVRAAPQTALVSRTCGFCGTVKRAPNKVSHSRCQTCWRSLSDSNVSR